MPFPIAGLAVTSLGAGLAGGAYYLFKKGKLSNLIKPTPSNGSATPAKPSAPQSGGGPVKPAVGPLSPDAKSANEANLGVPLKSQYNNYTEQVQSEGKAVPAAKALYAYLKANGVEPETAELKTLTLAFQKAHNADSLGKGLGGAISEDGLYGPGTSGALTLYTNDPIPGNPKYQPRQASLGEVLTNRVIGENGSNAGVTYRSAFNLNQYLMKNGHDNSAAEKALVTQFQHDVNTDPLFPGPAYKPSPKPPHMTPALAIDGILGPKSKGVLLSTITDDGDFNTVAKALKSIPTDPADLTYLRNAGRPTTNL